ncbi:C-type lectin 1-like isoform X2 [Pimephales promelas]|uniref:C-type lectin 1-like isoform X2 n=1 Tax=Pimephales promelas TaxID=90988 RepID=UPI0019554AF5|nr:C-type lectin 1-like isoform X2 [Pimephales promelas]
MRNAVIFVLLSALTPVAFSQLHDFIFVPLNVSWSEAQAFCREHYTDLATVDDKEDNDNLLNVMANVSSAWIGLHRTSSASPLIWSDQSGSTFSDWAAGQPNNYAGIQWCVNILYNKWSDQECFIKVPFVCYFGKRRQIVRLEMKSGQDLNDPEVKKEILAKMEQILKEKGMSGEAQLSWRTQSDGNVFQTKDPKKSDAPKQNC